MCGRSEAILLGRRTEGLQVAELPLHALNHAGAERLGIELDAASDACCAPLDGTINYLFGIPAFSVSVACDRTPTVRPHRWLDSISPMAH